MKISRIITLVAFTGIALLLVSAKKCGCHKSDPPKATVKVVYGQDILNSHGDVEIYKGTAAGGATVTVYSSQNGGWYDPDGRVLESTAVADGEGNANFEFKYESIYSVKAWVARKISYNVYDTLRGEGALILKEDETYNETVSVE